MAKKKVEVVETNVNNTEVLNKYLIKKEEREVLETFGEYKVYTPDKDFAKVIFEIAESSSKRLDEVGNLEIKGDTLAKIYKTVTNLPSDFLDNMNEILKATSEGYELSYDLKKIITSVNELVSDTVLEMNMNIEKIRNMNPKKRELFLAAQIETFKKETKTE